MCHRVVRRMYDCTVHCTVPVARSLVISVLSEVWASQYWRTVVLIRRFPCVCADERLAWGFCIDSSWQHACSCVCADLHTFIFCLIPEAIDHPGTTAAAKIIQSPCLVLSSACTERKVAPLTATQRWLYNERFLTLSAYWPFDVFVCFCFLRFKRNMIHFYYVYGGSLIVYTPKVCPKRCSCTPRVLCTQQNSDPDGALQTATKYSVKTIHYVH